MSRVLVIAAVLSLAASSSARAGGGAPDDQSPVWTFSPASGFIDDAMAFDDKGERLLLVLVSNEVTRLSVRKVSDHSEITSIDITPLTDRPSRVAFAGRGRYLVVWRSGDDKEAAAIVDEKGKVRKRLGPATAVSLTTCKEVPGVSVFDAEPVGTGVEIKYQVDCYRRISGRRIGARTRLKERAVDKRIDSLKMKRIRWLDGYTRIAGVKDGEWERKLDQRKPDFLTEYNLPARKFSKGRAITDVVAEQKRRRLLSKHDNRRSFVAAKWDRSALVGNLAGTNVTPSLNEPIHHYELKSIQDYEQADGSVVFGIFIDPVHPEALAKKRAVKRFFELYRVTKSNTTLLLRLPPSARPVKWVASASNLAVLEGSAGFRRGGKRLVLHGFAVPR